ncbi:hypothetical protein ASZ78_016247 [Callipepla squamata]|uniref:GCM domain-containing protein n=1 Tax=Callipepla squamata TaxID=9009 RepID=A0A226N6G4_CALSU|nr:hypothetical protein ASZ78_016247 [Callipepla squamata]
MLKAADNFATKQEDSASQNGEMTSWDINDIKLPQDVRQTDWFQEWPDSYAKHIYSSEDKNAQRHHSSWAMRNTNNHNSRILKKSCLGVVVCGNDCSTLDGRKIYLRPAICDKARQKQQSEYGDGNAVQTAMDPCGSFPAEAMGVTQLPTSGDMKDSSYFFRLITRLFLNLTYHNYFLKSKGAHDHPRPETKLEAEARRSIQKAHTAFSPPSPTLIGLQEIKSGLCFTKPHLTFPKSLTGEVPTQEALPLLLSEPDPCTLPASFGGCLSTRSLGHCVEQPPYPRAAEEHVEGRVHPAHGGSCTQAWSSPLHVPGVLLTTKGGHHPLRLSAGPLGEESCEGKAPLPYSLPPPSYPSLQHGAGLGGSHQHHQHLTVLLKESHGDMEERRLCVNPSCCNNLFCSLYPLR